MAKKNPAAVSLGSIKSPRKAKSSAENARKATAARLKKKTAAERSEQGRKAAAERWKR